MSWTDDDWIDLETPTLGDSQEYPDMMGGESMEMVADQSQEEPHIPKGWNRAEKMRSMRDKMKKCAEMREEKRLQPVTGVIEVERVKRKALTKRGEK